MSESKDIAFNDFKGAITVQEFKTVLRICEERYEKLAGILEQREKFLDKAMEQYEHTKESIEGAGMPGSKAEQAMGGLKKLLTALSKRGDRKMYKELKDDINEVAYLTEFLNRFHATNEQYEELDFSFLKKQK